MNRMHSENPAVDTAERIQKNVSNLPLTSMALAGLLGAGTMALISYFAPNPKRVKP